MCAARVLVCGGPLGQIWVDVMQGVGRGQRRQRDLHARDRGAPVRVRVGVGVGGAEGEALQFLHLLAQEVQEEVGVGEEQYLPERQDCLFYQLNLEAA